ncbi:MAG: 30S ribosomal protein S20 [Chloroflexota bacterium]
MPAKKTARVQERRRVENRRVRSATRTAVKKARAAITDAPTEAGAVVTAATAGLDRAASKGVVHPNAVARTKSRLQRALNKVQAAG